MGNRRAAELKILQPDLMAFLLQAGSQVQKPQGHGQTLADRIRRVDQKDFHYRIVSKAVDQKTLNCISK
jgi:hypothetical protein